MDRKVSMTIRTKILSILLTGQLITGCASAPAFRAHPQLEMRSRSIMTPQLIPPDIRIYELTAGGDRNLKADWCSAGQENVLKSIKEAFKEKQIEVKMMPVDKDIEEELEDIQALYRAVSTSIILHTYNQEFLFPEKQKYFDYTIGPIDNILKKFNTDALIFVYGIDRISTAGRQALIGGAILIGALIGVGLAVAAPPSFFIPSVGSPVLIGMEAISVALVDSSGTILWYSVKNISGGDDLRDYESCANLVKDIFSDFPELKK
jgi:hypothetical protein